MKKTHQIKSIEPGSIAQELELEPGDKILEINGQEIEDVLDYRFYIQNENINMVVEKKDGNQIEWEFDKDYYEDLGIEFENGLMADYRACANRCIFCFIDQMPPGMRKTLYFKDDDARLSFLQGNYITLTNMRQHDIDRIIKYHLSPINISVHTTNPELRVEMLHNKNAGKILDLIKQLSDAGIEMNGQIVMCKDINDKEELRKTLSDLASFYPAMQSVSVVPVGLSKFRDGLYPLKPIEKEDAKTAIDIIEELQKRMHDKYGVNFAYASDEFYLLADRELPETERYDGYVQLENGVGMLRLLMDETREALEGYKADDRKHSISVATGRLAYPFMKDICSMVNEKFPQIDIKLYEITNYYFGEMITVSGLITGKDLIEQLKGRELGSTLILPANMFKSDEAVLLDDITKEELEKALQVRVNIVKSDGQYLIDALLGEQNEETGEYHSPYEL